MIDYSNTRYYGFTSDFRAYYLISPVIYGEYDLVMARSLMHPPKGEGQRARLERDCVIILSRLTLSLSELHH